jgi:hypothetical protein
MSAPARFVLTMFFCVRRLRAGAGASCLWVELPLSAYGEGGMVTVTFVCSVRPAPRIVSEL